MKNEAEMTREELIALGWIKNPSDKMQDKAEKQLSAVEWLEEELKANLKKVILEGDSELMESLFEQAKEMEKEQIMKPLNQNEMNNNGIKIPKTVGGYRLGDEKAAATLHLTKRPKWLHRKMMKLCFGVEWIDDKQ